MRKKVIIITGPTAVGKTAAAIHVARHFQTEIISADSRQCFQEMSIGVARPSQVELQEIKHHFIASHSIHENMSAGIFEQYALRVADEIFQRTDVVVVAGGTGLYVKAFVEGMDEIPVVDSSIRIHLIQEYETNGKEWLQEELKQRDPLYFSQGSMQNPQRMLRALEVLIGTGKSIISFQQKNKKQRNFDIVSLSLDLPRETLYARINARVDQMMDMGLWEEAQMLYPQRGLNALQTVGYKEIFDCIDGKHSIDEAVMLIKRNTRHFAKRQCTWFTHQLPSQLFNAEEAKQIIQFLESKFTSDCK